MQKYRVLKDCCLPNPTGGTTYKKRASLVEGDYYAQFVSAGLVAPVVQAPGVYIQEVVEVATDAEKVIDAELVTDSDNAQSDANDQQPDDEPSDDDSIVLDSEQLSAMTKDELLEMCKSLGVSDAKSSMKKAEIVAMLVDLL